MEKIKTFLAPIKGKLLDISCVPDEVFADRVMGDGFALDILGGEVIAPMDGVVTAVFPGGHAVCLQADCGVQVLIHIGLETHTIKHLYKTKVEQGQHVKAGDLLVVADYKKLRKKAKSPIMPIVFLNQEKIELLKENEMVEAGDTGIIRITVQDA